MDFVASPIFTIIINIIAQGLVSRGILDQSTKDVFVQTVNNTLVATGSAVIGIYSIYKIIELHKHKITITAGQNTVTLSAPADVKTPQMPQVPQATPPVIPATPNSTPSVSNTPVL
jgi:hypothetical protein